jgi:hypothetical protein
MKLFTKILITTLTKCLTTPPNFAVTANQPERPTLNTLPTMFATRQLAV